jgi:hypothetical protein
MSLFTLWFTIRFDITFFSKTFLMYYNVLILPRSRIYLTYSVNNILQLTNWACDFCITSSTNFCFTRFYINHGASLYHDTKLLKILQNFIILYNYIICSLYCVDDVLLKLLSRNPNEFPAILFCYLILLNFLIVTKGLNQSRQINFIWISFPHNVSRSVN